MKDYAESGPGKRVKIADPATPGTGAAVSSGVPKYNVVPSVHSRRFVDKLPKGANPNLIEASYAKATWSKHNSALNSVCRFEVIKNVRLNWPIILTDLCEYVSWALTDEKLSPNTVKSYLSSLKVAHELKNIPFYGNNAVISAMIRGAENLKFYDNLQTNSRKVMTIPLLKLIGHQIARSDWCDDSKITVWAACTTAFFGALRFGEILPSKTDEFCMNDTLLWKDVKFRKDRSILIHVKVDKSRNPQGSYIDLFEYKSHNCCPVETLLNLRSRKENPEKPVFQFQNGKNLCSSLLNKILRELLLPVIGPVAIDITGHSFRAGLPSAMATNPGLVNDNDIKSWGRWSSESYQLYTRLKIQQKKCLFEKIVSVLDKNK
jgi:hypothetical protein